MIEQRNDQTATEQPDNALHPATDVGSLTLRVADLNRSVNFYTDMIGLTLFGRHEREAILGSGNRQILKLQAIPGAPPAPTNATGLYHAAILFPDRHALAVKIAQLSTLGIRFGYADHLVSEAFYLSDPDENGLELYRDRQRSEWHWGDGQVQMASDPIDFDSFFGEVTPNDPALADPAAPVGTKLGHMHLRVGNIPEASRFYHGVLAFDIVMQMPSALFVSAGGYHHHIGMNIWESRSGKPAPVSSAGLQEYSIVLPDLSEVERLARKVEAAGVAVQREADTATLSDPFRNQIRLITADQLAWHPEQV